MDINAIAQRLEAMQPKPKPKYEKIDKTKVFWRPTVGKKIIRIVPFKENPKDLGKTVYVHYNIGKFPMLALTNYGEKDPIVEFSDMLKANNDKEDWKLSKKLEPKMRVFIPVVVRGEEEMGTRLWEVGKTMYTELLKIAADEDYGDFTDMNQGHDFTVETQGKDTTGTDFNKSTIRIKPKSSPITDDKGLLLRILDEQPDILKVYNPTPYDEMKKILQNFLAPEEVEESESNDSNIGTTSLEKKSKSQAFSDLFEEEK